MGFASTLVQVVGTRIVADLNMKDTKVLLIIIQLKSIILKSHSFIIITVIIIISAFGHDYSYNEDSPKNNTSPAKRENPKICLSLKFQEEKGNCWHLQISKHQGKQVGNR